MTRSHTYWGALTLCLCISAACSGDDPAPLTPDMSTSDMTSSRDMPPVTDMPLMLDMSPPADMTRSRDASPDLRNMPDLSDLDMADMTDMTDMTDMMTDMTDMTDMADMAHDADMPTGLPDGPSSMRQQPRYIGDTLANFGYHEYLPPGYGDGQTRPILIFWHGVGENGDGTQAQLDKVLRNGPPHLIARDEWERARPFIVLSPQHTGGGCPSAQEIESFTTYALSSYDVDLTRVYQTGLSCGAIGLWNYMARDRGNVTVAAVAIAGNGTNAYNRAGCELGQTAIWGFHGDNDPTVNVSGTLNPIDGMLADCPSPPRAEVLKTIYPGVGHNSWSRTYDLSAGHDIYSWLLTHQKTSP